MENRIIRRRINNVIRRSNNLLSYLQLLQFKNNDSRIEDKFYGYQIDAMRKYEDEVRVAYDKLVKKLTE